MELTIAVLRAGGETHGTIEVPPAATVADLGRAVGFERGPLWVDGHRYPPESQLSALGLRSGCSVADHRPSGPPVLSRYPRLHQVAGPGSGRQWPLVAPVLVGPAGPRINGTLGWFGLTVRPDGRVEANRASSQSVTVDGRPLEGPTVVGSGVIVAGERAWRVALPAPEQESARRPGQPWNRAPRLPTAPISDPPPPPDLPPPPQRASPVGWLSMLLPLPVGVVMAVLVAPSFLLFAAMSPLMALGRWAEQRWRYRRARHEHEAELARLAAGYALERDRLRDEALSGWRAAHPDVAELAQRARGASSTLWERRPHHPDFMTLALGWGEQPWIAHQPGGGRPPAPPAGPDSIGPVPVALPMPAGTVVGIAGPLEARRALASWLVLQATTLHGPGDLAVEPVLSASAQLEWDWLKWLPHLGCASGALTLRLVDDEGARAAAPTFGSAEPADTVALVLEARVADLPSECTVVVEFEAAGTVTVRGRSGRLVPVEVSAAIAAPIARTLAGVVDADRGSMDRGLTTRVNLVELLDLRGVDDVAIAARWAEADVGRRLPTMIGRSETGAVGIDLVNDGPHALIAGTTGAGKSELLRTLVAGLASYAAPSDLQFILIDFKGGGAFDVCAQLPHTVAVVTDLDESLAARALRCLRAEVRYRETVLRAAGVSDFAAYRTPTVAGPEPLARLVVVVDEFATLAAELPEFLGSLVDIAQRGRSLGLHLVLATQRPTGVVDGKIRANTNLRIALRLQDDIDSLDLIGSMAAARLPAIPGRGCVRAASEITTVQTALVSQRTALAGAGRPGIAPFTLATRLAPSNPGRLEPQTTTAPADDCPSDLAALVAAAAAGALRLNLAPPRMPWPPPLPVALDLTDLPAPEPGAVALGLADLPDEQRQAPWWWRPSTGSLLVMGGPPGDGASALVAAALGLATSNSAADLHVFAMTGGHDLVRSLAQLPHVGSVAGADQPELLWRLLEELTDEVATRAAPGTPAAEKPNLLILIDDLGAVTEALESVDPSGPMQLASLVRNAASHGVWLIATARSERGPVASLFGSFEHRLVLRMADPSSYLLLGLRPRDVGVLPAGRAVSAPDGGQVQLARVNSGDVARVAETVGEPARHVAPERRPRSVRVLGHEVGLFELPAPQFSDRGWVLPVGLDRRLRPVSLTLTAGGSALVVGPAGSGKTTALATLAAIVGAGLGDDGAVTVVLDMKSGAPDMTGVDLVDHQDGQGLAAALARHNGRPHLVLVDDAELVPESLAASVAKIVAERDNRRHVIIAGRPETVRSAGHFSSAARAGRSGILLQPSPVEGDIFRTTLPTRALNGLPPGRGVVVNLGVVHVAQLGRDLAVSTPIRGEGGPPKVSAPPA
ncbi:MAG: putative FtsK/SpoIIIE family protein [Acidimicrobiia bacterium]|nr:putative FtsK/SpoIIIE family protein [Acidimicrobiia bacterium]